MKTSTSRILTLSSFVLTLAALGVPPAECQSGKSGGSSSPGQYRPHGQYRSGGVVNRPRPFINRDLSNSPWNPSFHHQNKFFQVTPGSSLQRPFTGQVPRSGVFHRGGLFYNIVTPVPVLPGYGSPYYGEPYYFDEGPEEPPPPPPAPAPQVYVIQPTPAPAPPPAAPPAETYEPPPPPPPGSDKPGDVALAVQPADTRILINDRFVGTGESLAAKGEPLLMKPGVYVIEAEHPSYKSQRLVFAVTPNETVRIIIDLTAERPGRRARVDTGKDDDFLLN